MPEVSKPAQWIVWGGLAAIIVGIAIAFVRTELNSPRSAPPPSPGEKQPSLPTISTVSEFSFTNQFGETVTRQTFEGRPWVADIIFTRCPSICPQMSTQMSQLQKALGSNSPVKLVSVTTDPDHDTPAVLKEYGELFGAVPGRWHFLTGAKLQMSQFIRDDLKLIAEEKPAEERTVETDLFNHSALFAIVDSQGRLRRVVHSNDTNINLIEEIVATLSQLQAPGNKP
ncbi:MAG: protein SCO1/2 [Candidatus Binatia bacterium]|jgi:protein SCO1/2